MVPDDLLNWGLWLPTVYDYPHAAVVDDWGSNMRAALPILLLCLPSFAQQDPDLEQRRVRVLAVVGRWEAISSEFDRLEVALADSAIPTEQLDARKAEALSALKHFLATTPRDSTSQATALGLSSWIQYLAGSPEEAYERAVNARELDPDVPHGHVRQALMLLHSYVAHVEWPAPVPGPQGLEFPAPPPETRERKLLRERLEEVLVALRRARLSDGDEEKALDAASKALAQLVRGDYANAWTGLGRVIDSPTLAPIRPYLLNARAQAAFASGESVRALEDLARLSESWSRWGEVQSHIGLVHHVAAATLASEGQDPGNHFEDADAAYQRAIQLNPKAESSYRYLRGGARLIHARHMTQTGVDASARYRGAIEDFTHVLAAHPGVVEVLRQRVDASIELSGLAGLSNEERLRVSNLAISDLTELSRGEPKDLQVLVDRADCRYLVSTLPGVESEAALDQARQAIDDYEQVLQAAPGNPQVVVRRGRTLHQLGRILHEMRRPAIEAFERAISDLDSVIAADPKSDDLCELRGQARMYLGRELQRGRQDPTVAWNAALADLAEAIRGDPARWKARRDRGRLFEWMGKYEEAIPEYEAAVRLAPEDAWSRGALARSRAKAGSSWATDMEIADARFDAQDYASARPLFEGILSAASKVEESDPELRTELCFAARALACVHALLSQGQDAPGAKRTVVDPDTAARHRDRAFELLFRAVSLGWDDEAEAKGLPDLAPLRDDPRWQPLLEALTSADR